MEKIKVYLLEDHKIVRDGLKSILALDPVFEIVSEESHPKVFLEKLALLKFHILLLDLSLPDLPGMDVLKEVKKRRPEIHVIILSMHDNPQYMIKALKEGASAYLTKDTQAETLIEAIKEVHKEGVYYPSQIQLKSGSDSLKTEETKNEEKGLTPKEIEVLKAMIKGLSSKQIAAEFGLSSRTIEAHRLNIMKKLGTSNSAESIAIAMRHNLI